MFIYTVKPGDTLTSVASSNGISVDALAADNGLDGSARLALGQALIVNPPIITHIVTEGETLSFIAAQYGTTESQLLYENPAIVDADSIVPGQVIYISGRQVRLGNISVNGYVYDYVNPDVLRQTLPYLTWVTVFGYGLRTDGSLVYPNDSEIIAAALSAGVAPVMLLTAMTDDGRFSSENASYILNNLDVQQTLINNIYEVAVSKGYYAVDSDFEYVPSEDRQAYADFITRLRQRLNPSGIEVFVALAPKVSDDQRGLLYESHDYGLLGNAADQVLLMTYEWGYAYSQPMAVAPINSVRRVLEYGLTRIDASKILMGIPNYGYDWNVPTVENQRARTISNSEAIELAVRYGAEILFDEESQTPHFNYVDESGQGHDVWFEDARSLNAKLRLVAGESLNGIGVWNVMNFFQPLWTLTVNLFNIRKIVDREV